MLDTIILEKEQTIQEQQKVIRRLLKKTSGETLKQPNYCEDGELTGSSGVSPASSIPAINEILCNEDTSVTEISFSVPNLQETKEYNSRAAELALGNTNDTDEKVERAEKNKTVKIAERLAKKRE